MIQNIPHETNITKLLSLYYYMLVVVHTVCVSHLFDFETKKSNQACIVHFDPSIILFASVFVFVQNYRILTKYFVCITNMLFDDS